MSVTKLKQMCKHTIQLEVKSNDGYGASYSAPVDIENVYFEDSIQITRGLSDTTASKGWFLVLQDIDIKQGDRVTSPNSRKYIATEITRYYEPKSTIFRHLEVILDEVNNG